MFGEVVFFYWMALSTKNMVPKIRAEMLPTNQIAGFLNQQHI